MKESIRERCIETVTKKGLKQRVGKDSHPELIITTYKVYCFQKRFILPPVLYWTHSQVSFQR
jgi:hypothetical protein